MSTIFPLETPSQKAVVAVAIIFSILPATAVGLRVVAKRIVHRGLDWSDYLIVAASVVVGGMGLHVEDVRETYGPEPIAITFKLSTILVTFSICQPVEMNWNPLTPGGHCGNRILSFRLIGAVNVITDCFIFILPVKYLIALRIQLHRKIVLIATFTLGLFTCILSIVRIVILSEVDFTDVTHSLPDPVIWSGLEPSVAVTLACIPLLRPLIRRRTYSQQGSTTRPTIQLSSVKNDGTLDQMRGNNLSQLHLTPQEVHASCNENIKNDAEV
ncbi:uncharacterized protein BCR38DRAFT_461513 [Pseudomassariella vexata]|uniref:Rhodopsin domain-containing protein n=1 Tax=Pseudomassariella vexata TaxID=1141098 RepID=A0A1Y2DCF8_9PEZI|nr:uncharacterized protein BCR38DRAFT_461513 [Pseudomassariella vexata]ORY56948.1 hypothetical protein BCR38DRAFT_461513 [Pseudomassariella vexata]